VGKIKEYIISMRMMGIDVLHPELNDDETYVKKNKKKNKKVVVQKNVSINVAKKSEE
jgi:hypothetical protein